jgi:hypothetical protein
MLVERGTVLQRVSWTAILAGLLAGLVTQAALIVLGLAIGLLSVTDGLDNLGNIAVRAVIWLALSSAVAAYVAGLTAARSAGYLTPAQGRFNGLLTGMLLLLVSTLFSANLLSRLVDRVTGAAGQAASTVAGAAGGAISGAANGGLGNALEGLGLGDAYQAITTGLDENELNQIVAEASPELNQTQVAAATGVIRSIINNASRDLGGNLSNVSALPDLVSKRVDAIQKALQGPQFVSRLRGRGLSQAQAQEVATVVGRRATELRTQAENTAKAVGEQANRATQAAADAAGKAAWGWLLLAGLTLGLAALGGGRGSDVPKGGATVVGPDENLVERDLKTAVRNDPAASGD